MAKRLFDDDEKWVKIFAEAAFSTGSQGLRSALKNSPIHGDMVDPVALWNSFKELMCSNLQYRLRNQTIPKEIEDSHLSFRLHLIF